MRIGALNQTIPYGLPNTLSIGTVTDGDFAQASISGASPNQTLNLVLKRGEPNTLSIGTVVDGDSAGAEITGTAPNQTLNLTLPKGDTGEILRYQGPANTLYWYCSFKR